MFRIVVVPYVCVGSVEGAEFNEMLAHPIMLTYKIMMYYRSYDLNQPIFHLMHVSSHMNNW